jgi:hypothetical protein
MINSKRWWCSVFVASVVNKSIFVFSNLISTKNENNDKVVGKLFLMIKNGPRFMGSLMHSLIKDMMEIGSYN